MPRHHLGGLLLHGAPPLLPLLPLLQESDLSPALPTCTDPTLPHLQSTFQAADRMILQKCNTNSATSQLSLSKISRTLRIKSKLL